MLKYKHLLYVIAIIAALLLGGNFQTAHAKAVNSEYSDAAIKLAIQINEQDLTFKESWIKQELNKPNISSQRRLTLLRYWIWHILSSRSNEKASQLAKRYLEQAIKSGNATDIALGELYLTFANSYSFDNSKETHDQAMKALQIYLNSPNWAVANRASSLQNMMDLQLVNANLALENSIQTFQLIPDDNTIYVHEAKIISYEDMAYLYNYLKNPKLAVETTQNLIALAQQENLPINSFEIINNFIYSFGAWRDLETATILAEELLKLENTAAMSTSGLTHMRLARSNNELAEYSAALRHAEISIKTATIPTIVNAAKLNKIIALAGLGQVSRAEAELDVFISEQIKTEGALPAKYEKHINYARALIALRQGDADAAQRYFGARLDSYIQDILTANNSETASMLAELQNSKERQSEREKAMHREARFKDMAIEEQKTVNRLLSVMTFILAIAAAAAFLFARYRTRISKTLAIAAKKALAGEKAKTEFLAVASHELRTPLNGIIGLSDMMRQSVKDPDLREKNQLVYKSGMNLLHVVENILEMTQIENGATKIYPEPANVHKLVNDLAKTWKQDIDIQNKQMSQSVKFTYHIDTSVAEIVEIDSRRLQQCLNNLLSNAAKFTKWGRIHLHVTAGEPDSDKMMGLTFTIADTGIGIEPKIIPDLFKPFAQADSSRTRMYDGTGLGLAITNSLAQMMDGSVKVMSKYGRGSEFTLTLPARYISHVKQILPVKKKRKVPGAILPPIKAEKAPLKILLTEDNIGNRNAIKSCLAPIKAQVTIAENGKQALDMLETQIFDLVLMDISLPIMDGITATRQIRQPGKPYKDIPIIMLTANVEASTQARSILAGVNMFMSKPVKASELIDAINFALTEKHTDKKLEQAEAIEVLSAQSFAR